MSTVFKKKDIKNNLISIDYFICTINSANIYTLKPTLPILKQLGINIIILIYLTFK